MCQKAKRYRREQCRRLPSWVRKRVESKQAENKLQSIDNTEKEVRLGVCRKHVYEWLALDEYLSRGISLIASYTENEWGSRVIWVIEEDGPGGGNSMC